MKKRGKLLLPQKKKHSPRTYHLRNAMDVRRFLSRIANEMWRSKLDPQIGSKVVYASSVILKSIEVGDLAKEIRQLRQEVDEIRNKAFEAANRRVENEQVVWRGQDANSRNEKRPKLH